MKTLLIIMLAMVFVFGVKQIDQTLFPTEQIYSLYIRDFKDCVYKFQRSGREILISTCMQIKGW